jgi:nucleoside-diphosphate-sugar epimerase
VLGATGFVGRWVARALAQRAAELHLGVRDAARLEPLREPYGLAGRVWTLDLLEAGAVARLCRELRPALVFNLAGYGVDPAERDEATALRINQGVPAELARALADGGGAAWPGQALVQAGSALEYGPVDGPVCESLPSHPQTLYGRSKLLGARSIEEVTAQSSLRAVEGRIFTAYGPGERPGRLLPGLLRARASGEPLALTDGRQRRDFVYVGDVAEALLRLGLLEVTGFESLHVATGRLHAVRDFIRIAAEVLEIPAERLRFGARSHLPEEMWHGPVSVERLRGRLGWTPPTLPREGIEATLRAVQEERLR